MKIDGLGATAAVVRNSLRTRPGHFKQELPRNEALALFKRSVELIEFETTAYCNRVCSFCPNSFLDRRTVRTMLDPVWATILAGLRETDYDGTVVWSRYSEPTSEVRLAERIKQVREAAPNCRIAVNSNGDYLNEKMLASLAEAGLDRLWIDVYFDDEKPPSEAVCMEAHNKLLKRLNRPGRLTSTASEYVWDIEHPTIEITSHTRNAQTMAHSLSDRGGLIGTNDRAAVRSSPCYAVFKHLVIDWNGSVMPCCQLRSDSPKHQNAIMGKVGPGELDLVGAYLALAPWRKTLAGFGPKEGACAGCNVYEYQASAVNVAASQILMSVESPLVRALQHVVDPFVGRRKRY